MSEKFVLTFREIPTQPRRVRLVGALRFRLVSSCTRRAGDDLGLSVGRVHDMTLRRVVAVALTALACANAYLLPPLGRTLPSRTGQLSRAAVVLKKGRAQGGTPKISLRGRKKIYTARAKTDGLTQPSQGPKKRMPSLSSKRQWERHIALLDAGAQPWCVFARATGEAEWLDVGLVTHDAAVQNASAAGAVLLHKRLILKHAAQLYPLALGTAESIELGLCEQPKLAEPVEAVEGAEAVAAAKDAKAAAVTAMEAAAAATAEPLSADVHAAPREACGFAGKPDESSGQYWTDASPIPAQGMRQKGDASKKDTKSSVAQAFSESLGLRN